MFEIGDAFINKRTRKRLKIVEIKHTQEMSEIVTRYRMGTDDLWLTAAEVRREYGQEVEQPAQLGRGR